MASNETVLKINAVIDGLQGLNQLRTALRKSAAEAKGADNDFKGLVQKVRELQVSSVKSINNLNAQKDAFKALRDSVDVTSKEFKEARDEIEKIDRALKEASGTVVKYSKNSINALRAQKSELLAVRDSADLMSKEFKEAGVELAKLDKKLAKAEGRGRGGRLKAGAQVAGTVAGAGVFGGPEGAIGALGGGLIGGVGGAVLGGAIGAQVGQARKAAGEVAEFVAKLNLAKGALGGVSKDIVEYNQNLDFAREISKKYAIRLTDVIKGYTGVTAAAKANNLTVKQTQAIYEGITVSGVAAGKSQEDLQALFLATTQVLSKGKASAEEISGQIGERIPGAVAKFAAANKISLQELAEQFKKGEVTIAKFVRFTEQQGEDYAEVAESLASGPEKAGLRLQIALDEAGEAFGGFFLNTGAGFQDYLKNLVDFVVENQVEFKKLIAATIVFAEDFVNIFVNIGEAIWDIFGPLFELIGNTLKGFIEATADVLQQGQAERAARRQGIDAFAVRKEAEAQIVKEDGGRNYLDIGQGDRISKRYTQLLSKKAGLETETSSRTSRIDAYVKAFGGEYVAPAFAKPGQTAPPAAADLDGGGDGNGTGKTKTKGPGQADFSMLEGAFARDAALRVKRETAALGIKILKAETEGNKAQVFALKQEQEMLKVNQIIINLEELTRQRAIQIVNAQTKGLDVTKVQSKQLDDQNNLQLANLEKSTLLQEQELKRLQFQKEITAELDKQRKSFEAQFTDRQKALGLISSDDYNKVLLDREGERLADPSLGLTSEQQARGLDQYRQTIDPTLVEGLTQNIAKLKKDLAELVNPINQVTSAANAIGTAFSNSFKSVIDGTSTTQEALAGFFKNIASYFLDMAVQIIQKMITMYILNTVVGLLPGSPGGGGGGIPFLSDAPSITGNKIGNFGGGTPLFAKGGVFAQNKIVPYAKGGIVNKPTMFAYANGGTGRFGLMGEAGPEAIMPLSRGSNGKLGVQASGGVGNVVVNVDASGTKAEGDSPNAKQLGSLIGAAVQAELVKQQRPGGILAS